MGAGKICIACGVDCDGRPRVKDAQGRYMCQGCYDARLSRTQKKSEPEAGGAFGLDHPESGHVVSEAELTEASRAGMPEGELALAEAAPEKPKAGPCPACGRSLSLDASVCVNCGFDKRKGFQHGTGVNASATSGGVTKCPGCGYSLKGLKKPRCPECGKLVVSKSKSELLKEESRRTVVEAYRTPAIMAGVGIGLLFLAELIRGNAALGVAWLTLLLIFVPIGVSGYLLCCKIWLGFNAPVQLIALNLAATYALAWGLENVVSVTIAGIVGWFVGLVTYYACLTKLLDLDMTDAFLVTIVTVGLRLLVLSRMGGAIIDIFT